MNAEAPAVADPTAEQAAIAHRAASHQPRAALRARFVEMLGARPGVDPREWRAIGDPEIMRQQVTNSISWLTSVAYGLTSDPHPTVPHRPDAETGALEPAEGTAQVHDAIVAAVRQGLDLSAIKTEWDNALREVLAVTQGAPGFRGVK
jgi:hypothetical protein